MVEFDLFFWFSFVLIYKTATDQPFLIICKNAKKEYPSGNSFNEPKILNPLF